MDNNVMSEMKLLSPPEKVMSFAQANVEAVMASGKIWTEGVLGLSRLMAEAAKVNFDEIVASWKAMSGVTSPKEAMQLQANLVRSSFDKSIKSSSEMAEASLKLIEQTMAPLKARMTLAADKFVTSES